MSPGIFDRRALLGAASVLGTFLLDPGPGSARGEEKPASPVGDDYPTEDAAVVREIVTVSHFNLDRVRELVEARPELANAAWDWGFGDWESGLGAADPVYPTVDLSPEQTAQAQGTFTFGPRETDRLTIESSSMGGLMMRRGAGMPRQLFHLGSFEFHPAGAPSAKIRLVTAGEPRLEIRNPDLVLSAARVASQ